MARVKRTEDVGNLGRRARGGSGSVSCTCEGEGRLDGLDQGSRGSQEGRERERERGRTGMDGSQALRVAWLPGNCSRTNKCLTVTRFCGSLVAGSCRDGVKRRIACPDPQSRRSESVNRLVACYCSGSRGRLRCMVYGRQGDSETGASESATAGQQQQQEREREAAAAAAVG